VNERRNPLFLLSRVFSRGDDPRPIGTVISEQKSHIANFTLDIDR
jgi:hypothetical protein